MSTIAPGEGQLRNGRVIPVRGRPNGALNQETGSLPKPKTVQISGLRVYVKAAMPGISFAETVFYSRRADGPYYRWSYKEKPGQWHGSRMHTSDLSPRELCLAKWKGVPQALRASLAEHYLE